MGAEAATAGPGAGPVRPPQARNLACRVSGNSKTGHCRIAADPDSDAAMLRTWLMLTGKRVAHSRLGGGRHSPDAAHLVIP